MSDDSARSTVNHPAGAEGWLLPHLGGAAFTVLVFGDVAKAKSLASDFTASRNGLDGLDGAALDRRSNPSAWVPSTSRPRKAGPTRIEVVVIVPAETIVSADAVDAGLCVMQDVDGLAARRYDARPGTVYLVRPDQHVCARFRDATAADLQAAVRRALGETARLAAPAPAPSTDLAHAA